MKKPKLNISIVDCHDRALYYIYREIGKKRIPENDLTLLHFDAHPDMTIPPQITSDMLQDWRNLLDLVSIESWIIPLLAKGHVKTVIWYHPPWSTQFPDQKHYFKIGDSAHDTNYLSVDLPENYYIADGTYSNKFLDTKPIHSICLDVRTLPSLSGEQVSVVGIEGPWILDIDLDTFCTNDPFRLALGDDIINQLTEIFPPDPLPPDPTSIDPNQILQLQSQYTAKISELKQSLTSSFEYIEKSKNKQPPTYNIPPPLATLVKDCHSHFQHRNKTDPERTISQNDELNEMSLSELVYAAGCSLTLPHYISSTEEQNILSQNVAHILTIIASKSKHQYPGTITIAKSTWDEYLPADQCDGIEKLILAMLRGVYQTEFELNIHHDDP